MDQPTDQPTDRLTNGGTDKVGCRVVCMRLKKAELIENITMGLLV